MVNQIKMSGLGSKEAELIAAISSRGLRVFTIAEAARVLKLTNRAVSKLVHQLTLKRKLQPIERARYLLIPPEAWKAGECTEEGTIIASQPLTGERMDHCGRDGDNARSFTPGDPTSVDGRWPALMC